MVKWIDRERRSNCPPTAWPAVRGLHHPRSPWPGLPKGMMRMSKAEDNSHPTSDADKPPPEKGDAEKNNPAQHEFARTQLKKATEMATAFVSRLQPPPGNPKAMIYDLVCHTLGGLIWTLQQTKSDMQRGYCKLSDRKEFVEIEQSHFDTIIHQHHPEYRGEPLPLTQSRADILIKEIVWRVNELLGPVNNIKSDDARNDLLAQIDRFTKQTIARYTVEPFGKKEVVKEMAALQQIILRWIDRWQLPISPQNIAYHVHWAFSDYCDAIRDFEGPLPPTAGAMRPAEGVHYLESLIRRLEELGEQEYFAPDGNSDGDGKGSDNRDKSATKATRVAEARLDETKSKAKASHSVDFTFVNWYGTEYTFALGVQSSAVEALWDEWEKSGLGLHQDTIRNSIDAERDSFRMDKAFRNHPAFGTMIQSIGDGKYKLASLKTGKGAPTPSAKKSTGIPAKARQKPR
jgi:hypothetical protein